MKKFKKRINIENATSFKLEYYEGGNELKSKEFNTYKAMEQFHNRQTDFMYLDFHRYALVDGIWHRFMKLRSPFVFQEELDFINKTFTEESDSKNLQNIKLKKIKLNNKTKNKMSNRVIKIIMEDGSYFDFEEKPIDHFLSITNEQNSAKYKFFNQHHDWEIKALSYFNLDIEDFAKEQYNLIDSYEAKTLDDYSDDEILEYAEYRDILPPVAEVENPNILNDYFIDRFVTIINRGNTAEIDNTLSFLEFKYKI